MLSDEYKQVIHPILLSTRQRVHKVLSIWSVISKTTWKHTWTVNYSHVCLQEQFIIKECIIIVECKLYIATLFVKNSHNFQRLTSYLRDLSLTNSTYQLMISCTSKWSGMSVCSDKMSSIDVSPIQSYQYTYVKLFL